VINSFSSLSPSAIVRILKHSQSQYTEGDSFCKYYSIAFAIHTRLAGGLAQELWNKDKNRFCATNHNFADRKVMLI